MANMNLRPVLGSTEPSTVLNNSYSLCEKLVILETSFPDVLETKVEISLADVDYLLLTEPNLDDTFHDPNVVNGVENAVAMPLINHAIDEIYQNQQQNSHILTHHPIADDINQSNDLYNSDFLTVPTTNFANSSSEETVTSMAIYPINHISSVVGNVVRDTNTDLMILQIEENLIDTTTSVADQVAANYGNMNTYQDRPVEDDRDMTTILINSNNYQQTHAYFDNSTVGFNNDWQNLSPQAYSQDPIFEQSETNIDEFEKWLENVEQVLIPSSIVEPNQDKFVDETSHSSLSSSSSPSVLSVNESFDHADDESNISAVDSIGMITSPSSPSASSSSESNLNSNPIRMLPTRKINSRPITRQEILVNSNRSKRPIKLRKPTKPRPTRSRRCLHVSDYLKELLENPEKVIQRIRERDPGMVRRLVERGLDINKLLIWLDYQNGFIQVLQPDFVAFIWSFIKKNKSWCWKNFTKAIRSAKDSRGDFEIVKKEDGYGIWHVLKMRR